MRKEVMNMMKADEFMKDFMDELENERLKKDNQPNNGPEITDAFIEKRIQGYTELLNSGLMDCIND